MGLWIKLSFLPLSLIIHFYFSYLEQGTKNLQMLNKLPESFNKKGFKLFSFFIFSKFLTTVLFSFHFFYILTSLIPVKIPLSPHSNGDIIQCLLFLFIPIFTALLITETAKLVSFSLPVKGKNPLHRYFIQFFYYFFYPFTLFINSFFLLLKKFLSFNKFEEYFHIDWKFLNTHFLSFKEESKGIITEEKKMIHSIYELSETTAKEIMIPRIDVIGFDSREPVSAIKDLTEEHGHSRFPVYEDSLDHILGIVYIKDLFLKFSQSPDFELVKILRPAIYVPETKKIDQLLKEFKTRKVHIAVVVDEYGGTAGIITLEDILEEIVGEIQDEFDEDEFIYQQLDKNAFLINGAINIDDLNELLNIELPSEDYDTLGGFIYDLLGAVPHKDQRIEYKNMIFFIDELQGQRINRVKLIFPEIREDEPL